MSQEARHESPAGRGVWLRAGVATADRCRNSPAPTQVDRRLVHADEDGELPVLTRTNGDEVRLRLPSGYSAPGPDDESGGISVSQWLDDDTVALWSSDGGGDLPAMEGDILVCELPDGVCRVEAPLSSRAYVLPVRESSGLRAAR